MLPTLDAPPPEIQIPPEALERDKPESAMAPCEELSRLPASLVEKSEVEQAKYLLTEEIDFIHVYSECAIKQAALADWIDQEQEP